MEYTLKIEKPSNIQRKLIVTVSANTVNNRIQKMLTGVQKTAKIKGFRPGFVPMPVIRQQFLHDVKHQVFHDLIDESYRKALHDEQLKAIGAPKIDTSKHQKGVGEHDHGIEEGQELSYTATVEVLPEIEVKAYTGIALTQDKVNVTEKDVDALVETILNNHAEIIPMTESRAAKKGDFADIKFTGGIVTDKGIELKPGMDGSRLIEIGAGQLIDGFEDNVIGMKPGETKTFRVPFPKDFFEKDLAGKDSEFTVTLNELKLKKLPELTDEFVKNMGYETVADLKKKVKEQITTDRTQQSERKMKSDLLAALIEKNPFDVPEALIQSQTRALAQDVAQNLKQQGFTDQMIEEALVTEMEPLKKRADNQVRASLLLEAIAKKEKITVEPKEIEAEYAQMAKNMNVDEAKIREFYAKNPQRVDDLEFRLREDKTLKFLTEKAKIK